MMTMIIIRVESAAKDARGRNAPTPVYGPSPDEHSHEIIRPRRAPRDDSNNIIIIIIIQASNRYLREDSKGQSPPMWHFRGGGWRLWTKHLKKACAFQIFLKILIQMSKI